MIRNRRDRASYDDDTSQSSGKSELAKSELAKSKSLPFLAAVFWCSARAESDDGGVSSFSPLSVVLAPRVVSSVSARVKKNLVDVDRFGTSDRRLISSL